MVSEETIKNLEKVVKELPNPNAPIAGGVIVKTSDCCDAPVDYIGKGVIVPCCSKCGQRYEEPVYGLA